MTTRIQTRKPVSAATISKHHTEALTIHAMYLLHVEALAMDASMRLSHREVCARKREVNMERALSPFAGCAIPTTQSYRIDAALTEFHTMLGLTKLPHLDDCNEARVRSHVRYLEKHYSKTCRKVVNPENPREFKFELLPR